LRRQIFAFCLPFHSSQRYAAGMPSPLPNVTAVVECKGCTRNVPAGSEAVAGSIQVLCPICEAHRSYRVTTEVFLGRPHPDVMKKQRG
jgi:Zn finger protein HypA/HybF involved in hydrogenase expression